MFSAPRSQSAPRCQSAVWAFLSAWVPETQPEALFWGPDRPPQRPQGERGLREPLSPENPGSRSGSLRPSSWRAHRGQALGLHTAPPPGSRAIWNGTSVLEGRRAKGLL